MEDRERNIAGILLVLTTVVLLTVSASAQIPPDTTPSTECSGNELLQADGGCELDTNTDNQNLGTSGNQITLENGGSVTAPYSNNADKLDGEHLQDILNDERGGVSDEDWNTLTEPGIYGVANSSNFQSSLNQPTSAYTYGHLIVTEGGGNKGLMQMYVSHHSASNGAFWVRSGWSDGSWDAWHAIPTRSWVNSNDATGTDDQNLSEVLNQGNTANQYIDMNGYTLSNANYVQLNNIESVSSGQIGRDNSIGYLGNWGGNGNAVLWDSYNVIDGNAITVSGGTGDESNPTIAVTSGSIADNEISDNTVDSSEIQNGDNFAFGDVDVSSPSSTGSQLDVGGGANFNGNIDLNNGGGLDNVNDIEMDGNIYGAGVDMSLQEVGAILGPNNGDTDLNIQTQGSGSHVVSIEDGSSSNADIVRFKEGTQEVEVPNGALTVSNGNNIKTDSITVTNWGEIRMSSGDGQIGTAGGGSDRWDIRDKANNQDIARFKEGGNVEIRNGVLNMNSNRVENVSDPNSADDAASTSYLKNRRSEVALSHDGYISWDGSQFSWGNRLIVIPAGAGQGTHYNIENDSASTSGDDSPVSIDGWDLMFIRPSDSDVTSSGHVDPPTYVKQYGNYDPQPNDIPIAWVNGNNNFLHLASGEVLAPGERIDSSKIRRNRDLDLNGNTINSIGGLQTCGSNEFVNGNGNCETDTDTDTDNQGLPDVLNQDNTANGKNIRDVEEYYNNDGDLLYDTSNGKLYANKPNDAGGGIWISDDGGFYDYNDGWVRFEGSNGIDMSGNAIKNLDWSNANDLDGSGNLVLGSVADNEIADNTVDNSEIQNSDRFGFQNFNERYSWDISSGSGSYMVKLGEIRGRNFGGKISVIRSTDQGATDVSHQDVYISKRGDNSKAIGVLRGIEGQLVEIIVTDTNNDANGDGYNDSYVYASCADFCSTDITMKKSSGGFIREKTSGVSLTGTKSFESSQDIGYRQTPSGGIDLNGNTLTGIGGLQSCGSNQFVNGNGNCQTDGQVSANKDLVAGNALTGGANDVLVGSDSDVTVAVGSNTIDDNEVADNVIDNSEIQNSDRFTLNGVTLNGELRAQGNSLDLDANDQGVYIHDSTGNFNIKSGVADGSDTIVAGSGGSEIQMNENGRIELKIDESTAAGNTFGKEAGITLDNGQVSLTGGFNGCGSNEFVNGNGNCVTDTDTDDQTLSEVLSRGNAARGSTAIVDRFYADDHGIGGTPGISLAVGDTDTGLHSDTDGRLEFWTNAGERFSLTNSELKSQGASLNMNGNNITDSTGGNITFANSIKVHGAVWASDANSSGSKTLSDVLSEGNSAGSYNIDMNGNGIKGAGYVKTNYLYANSGNDLVLQNDGANAVLRINSGTNKVTMNGNIDVRNNQAQFTDSGRTSFIQTNNGGRDLRVVGAQEIHLEASQHVQVEGGFQLPVGEDAY